MSAYGIQMKRFALGCLRRTPRIDRFTLLLVALGLLGAALVLLRSANYANHGAGDALLYMSVAQSLLDGDGFVSFSGRHYEIAAPLFPLALAFTRLFGVDAIHAAGYINAAAFGLTIFVTAMWLRSRVRSRLLVAWAGCACALSLALANISAKVMTEALFILFIVLSLFALDRFLDTRQRSLLLLAAVCAALACLTRYIGLTVVAAALLLLLCQPGITFPARIRNAAAFSAIAITPIGAWLLRNFLNSGSPFGEPIPTDFSLLSSLNNAGSEFIKWVFGSGVFKYLDPVIAKISGISIGGDITIAALSVKLAILLALAIIVGYLLLRLSRGWGVEWRMWAVPAVFVAVYALAMAVSLPLSDVDLPLRYLSPLYPPLLVAVALVLNEFFRYAARKQPLATLPFLQKWNIGLTGRMALSLPTLILAIGLSLWLAQQGYANYFIIKFWMNEGRGYLSREWEESETTVQYLRSHPLDGHVWTNQGYVLHALTDVKRDRISSIGRMEPDKLHLRFDTAQAEGEDVYFVLLSEPFIAAPNYEYGLAKVMELPGIETVAELEDGVILKIARNPNDDAKPLDEDALLRAGLPKDAQPIIRSIFNVYLDEGRNRLIYARDDCGDDDIAPPFFLHVVPANHTDLPEYHRQFGFYHLDFYFDDHGFRLDGLCVAMRGLPAYGIAEISTGQFISGQYRLWTGEFDLAGE